MCCAEEELGGVIFTVSYDPKKRDHVTSVREGLGVLHKSGISYEEREGQIVFRINTPTQPYQEDLLSAWEKGKNMAKRETPH